MNGGITLAEPGWLLLLPLALLAAFSAARGTRVRLGRRAGLVRAARFLLLIGLVLALAEPLGRHREDRLTVIFAVDVSRSVGPEGREYVGRYLEAAAERLPDGDRAGVIVVGEEARVEEHPREGWRAGELLTEIGENGSDLAAAIRLSRGLFPAGHEKRLVLLTDGMETRGSLEDAILGADDPIDLVWVPVRGARQTEALVESISAPANLTEGQPHRVRVLIRSTMETGGILRLYRGDTLISSSRVRLRPGDGNLFSMELEAPFDSGPLLYRAELEAEGDGATENNSAATVVRVEGRPRVLAIDTDPNALQPLARALTAADMAVTRGGPASLPGDLVGMAAYDAIILSDSPATDYSDGQLESLGTYVHTVGGGLVMIGGPGSFGPGGYWKTAVEKVLPVELDVKDRRNYPTLGLVLCIDKSGSMAGARAVRKIDIAKAAAAEVATEMTPMDRIGVIAFDAAAKWVVPMTEGGDAGKVLSGLGTVRAGGGTDAYPAMELALETLREEEVRVKHVILLTDGQLAGRDHEGLASRMASRGISVSTLGIGTDADPYTLERIARSGTGEFYMARDISRVPRIFLREAFRVSRSWIEEEPFQPVLQSTHPALAEIAPGGTPPLEGYVVTSRRAGAQHLLATPKDDPLLSVWRHGLGKAAAFTSDAKGRWGRSWVQWEGYRPFWMQLVRWTSRDEERAGRLQAIANVSEGRLVISADLHASDGAFINGARPHAVVAGPDGARQEIGLEQVGPGRYRGEVDAGEPGVYMAAVVDGPSDAGTTTTTVLPYSSEFRDLDRAPDAMERLVAGRHARIEAEAEGIFRHTGGGGEVRWPLAPYLLALSAFFLLTEVAARKLQVRFPIPAFLARAGRTESEPSLVRLRGARRRVQDKYAAEADPEEQASPPGEAAAVAAGPSIRRRKPAGAVADRSADTTSRLLKAKRRRRRS